MFLLQIRALWGYALSLARSLRGSSDASCTVLNRCRTILGCISSWEKADEHGNSGSQAAAVGEPDTLRHHRAAPKRLQGHRKRYLGKPGQPRLRLARFEPRLLRWLFSRHKGHARLDHERGPSVCRAPAIAALEYHACHGLAQAGERRQLTRDVGETAAKARPLAGPHDSSSR